MKKVKVIDNSNNIFTIVDENRKIYRSIMWFENFATKPQPGDYMFISEQILDDPEEINTPKIYGPFTNLDYARKPEDMTERDFIVVVSDSGMVVHQRYYG